MKSQTKKRLRLFLVLYLVIILVAAVGTLGWFIFNRDVNVKNGVSITTGNYLRVSVDGSPFSEQVEFTPEHATLKDVSSGDGQNFYWPQLLLDDSDEPAEGTGFLKIDDTNCSEYYIVFDMKLRATEAMDVYLGSGSSVDPVEPINLQQQYDRQSLYGPISADGIAGAARVAILELDEGGHETLKQIWIPNRGYCLYYDDDGIAQITPSSSIQSYESYYSYYKPTADDPNVFEKVRYTAEDYLTYVNAGGLASPARAVKGEETTPALANDAPVLCHFNNADEEKTLRVRIWFEGTDREADKALNGGLVNYKLQLVGMNKADCPKERGERALEAIGFDYDTGSRRYKLFYDLNKNGSVQTTEGEAFVNELKEDGTFPYGAEVLYSYNGIDWHTVDTTETVDGSKQGYVFVQTDTLKYLYVKFRETATEKGSTIRTLELPAAK